MYHKGHLKDPLYKSGEYQAQSKELSINIGLKKGALRQLASTLRLTRKCAKITIVYMYGVAFKHDKAQD